MQIIVAHTNPVKGIENLPENIRMTLYQNKYLLSINLYFYKYRSISKIFFWHRKFRYVYHYLQNLGAQDTWFLVSISQLCLSFEVSKIPISSDEFIINRRYLHLSHLSLVVPFNSKIMVNSK
jgi:hypothetical protein